MEKESDSETFGIAWTNLPVGLLTIVLFCGFNWGLESVGRPLKPVELKSDPKLITICGWTTLMLDEKTVAL